VVRAQNYIKVQSDPLDWAKWCAPDFGFRGRRQILFEPVTLSELRHLCHFCLGTFEKNHP